MRNLATIRKKRGLTQTRLSELTGISQQCIQRYEHGLSSPSCEVLVILADALDTATDYLLERTDSDAPPNHISENELKPDEAHIVQEYRKYTDAGKNFLSRTMEAFDKVNKEIK